MSGTVSFNLRNGVYQGNGIPSCPPPPSIDPLISELANAIFHGRKFSPDLFQMRCFKAVFVHQDTELLKQFQNILQAELENLAACLPKNDSEAFVWSAFLGNILAILPFSYPQDNQRIHIPFLQDGICEMVEYKITTLPLEEPDAPSPMISLGLTPTSHKTANPILSFIGTTYPVGSGFLASLMTDFCPNKSVGEHAYESSKAIIDAWLQGKKNVRVVGCSLGGALAFHTLQDHPHELSQIDVYNPPGLYPECWKREFNEGCRIHIYQQSHDFVPWVGSWPTGKNIHLYQVKTTTKLPSHNFFTAHLRAYTGCEEIKIIEKDPLIENEKFKRKVLTFLHRNLGPLFIYLPLKLICLIYKIFH